MGGNTGSWRRVRSCGFTPSTFRTSPHPLLPWPCPGSKAGALALPTPPHPRRGPALPKAPCSGYYMRYRLPEVGPRPPQLSHYCPLRESSLTATIHSTSFYLIPSPDRPLDAPSFPWTHEVGPETRQFHLAPSTRASPPSSQPRDPTTPKELSAQPRAAPLLPAPWSGVLRSHDSLKLHLPTKTRLRLQLVSGSRPRSPSSRLLLVPPTPGPGQSEASGRQARVSVGACVRARGG